MARRLPADYHMAGQHGGGDDHNDDDDACDTDNRSGDTSSSLEEGSGGGNSHPLELTISCDEESLPADEDEETEPKVSHKTIGKIGSYAIAVNALAGPGILQLPYTYQQSGVIPTTLALLVVGLISALCCMHTASVVSKVPGNANFDKVVEFSDPYRIFWGRRAYYGTQIVFYLCTLCVNIAAIVDTSEVVDSFLGHSGMGSWGLSLDNGGWKQWKHQQACSRVEVKQGQCIPFDGEEYGNVIITLGYMITTVVFLPICLMDLKENTAWQIFGFVVLLTISAQFVICFISDGLSVSNVTLWGESWSSMLGVILFNFGLVMAVPSWLAEKKENVSVSRVVYGSTAVSLVLYVAVGLMGALAIPNVNVNALAPMTSGAFGTPLRIGASIFAFFIIGLDIPLFAVLTRYNLVNSGLCSKNMANLFVVYLPWSLSWLFYQGSSISEILSWGGILFTGALAFLLPLYLAIRILRLDTEESPVGSIDVYLGLFKSQAAELKATVVVLGASFACVAIAIAGQLYHDEEEEILRKESYLNQTLHHN